MALAWALAQLTRAQGEPPPPASAEAAAAAAVAPAPAAGADAAAGVRVLPTGGLDMEQAALLLSGQEGGLLPLALFASPLGPATGGAAIVVVIEVEGSALLAPERATAPLYLDVCLYVLSGNPPAVTVSVLETLAIDVEQQREVLDSGGVQIVRRLVLPAGAHSLRALVRNRATRDLGLRVWPLVVPAFGDGSPVLLGPFFDAGAGPWLSVARGDAPAPAWLAEAPAGLPLVPVETAARLQLVASSALAAGRFEVELRREGKTVATLPVLVHARAPAAEGLELLTLGFDPATAGAGVAELRVRGNGGVTTPPAKVVLTQGSPAGSWPAVLGRARPPAGGGGSAGAAAAPPPARRRLGRQGERLARRYREALRQLAGDQPEAGGAAVTALEAEALAGADVDPLELRDLERDVLAALAAAAPAGPETLWPVIEHYLESHRRHLAARNGKLATHAQQMVLHLADLYAGAVAADQRGLAAAPLLALVAGLPAAGEAELRVLALGQARKYLPEDAGVLLCIAVDAERHADYKGAVEALTALRKLTPQDLEVRLRLGVNQARLGEKRQARAELGAAIETAVADASEPPPWWLPLAYQELGRLHLASRDPAAAERVLRQGLQRLPREEKLSLLLAEALARRGGRAPAAEVVAAIQPTPDDRGFDSARHRYIQLPEERLLRARAEVAAHAAAGRASLAAALGGPPRAEGSP
jgi:Flp pilus assembly protein TadD